ncbi:MAG: hypothetical protein ACD_3C00086G0013 [uncultured bacterium (gcode 4)]|uniref:Uncharacterized protein n=1 Tax=uncultured bacterium (gcode 4) TaxID=1234023 RepID=K2GD90_9BACT|nr:MAG: hypothetical protein ACD_3C00086G0013 [uncultured bacterium (gcode 4)]
MHSETRDYMPVDIKKPDKGCSIDKSKSKDDISKYNASFQDFFKLVEWFDKFGKAEYIIFKDISSWPVLVIFKEIHDNADVKLDNFKAFTKFKQYFNFLWTEWTNKEVEAIWDILKLQWNVKNSVDFILNWKASFSSVAIEEFYWSNLNTCGIDLDWKDLKNLSWFKIIPKIAKKFWISIWEAIDWWHKNGNDYVISQRNNLWLNNIRDILITWNNNWKNFVPLIAWGAHAIDLKEKAEKYWFKWVIIFTPKSYK